MQAIFNKTDNLHKILVATKKGNITGEEKLREELGLKGFVIGFAGRLVPEKGLHTLLRALENLQRPVSLLILGRGPLKEELKEVTRSRGIQAVFPEKVSHEEVPNYLSAMDLAILPSETASHWKEQFGRVVVEAMACKVPVIGSDSAEIPVVIGDAGLTFPEGDAIALRKAIQELYDNPALRESLIAKGLQRVHDHYTWKAVAKIAANTYRSMANGGSSS